MVQAPQLAFFASTIAGEGTRFDRQRLRLVASVRGKFVSYSSFFSPTAPSPMRNSIASGYRSLAIRCKREAEQAGSPEFREKYLSMAEQWDLLASETERIYGPS